MQERLQTLSVEITTTSSELTELHRRLEVQDNAFSRERQVLQNTVEDLKKVEDRAQQAQLSLQDDVRKQSQVAKDAQEKYERELVAHAEGVRALAETKRALDEMRDRNRTIETEIETSRANQASAEASWKAQRETLQKELDDVQKRWSAPRRLTASDHYLTWISAGAKTCWIKMPCSTKSCKTSPLRPRKFARRQLVRK